ncbi:MAG: long-chain fatty acid--CoA ligase [Pseudomonadota bacterium]
MASADAAATSYLWEPTYPDGIDWRAPIDRYPLNRVMDEAAAQFADRPCADFMDKVWTYGQIGDLVDRFAAGLQALGVVKGKRVGLFLPNCPYYPIAYFAILKCGGIVVNFNPLYAEREIRHQIDDSGIELMVTLDLKVLHDKLLPVLGSTSLKRLIICPMAKLLPWPKSWLFPIAKRNDIAAIPRDESHVRFATVTSHGAKPSPVEVGIDDLAVLQYTGGTTGVPKGAMLSHGNLSANVSQCKLWFQGAKPGREVMLGVLPFFHVFAMTVVMNMAVRMGASIIMLPRFELPALIKAIDRKKPTLFPAVPTIYTAINHYHGLDKVDLSSLAMCFSGGAPLPMEVKQHFEELTGCSLVEGYGLSETAPVTNGNPLFGVNKAGSIGPPVPGTVVKIISLEDRETEVPQGERGEVCISGPQVMSGYWNNEEETDHALVDGLLHTGDVGYLDEDGYVFIVDRIKDLIVCSGFNVYPRNVEEAIYEHGAIQECIVAGVPDEYRGQTVKAYIRLKDGTSLNKAELLAFLKDKLSPIEMPKHVEFRKQPQPKTLIGKLDRKAIVEEEMRAAAAQG